MLHAVSELALLDNRGIKRADRLAENMGISVSQLIAHAGRAVAEAAKQDLPSGSRVAVWVGPGMNGADARVAAELLSQRHSVFVYALEPREAPVAEQPLEAFEASRYDLVIDGLFGTGLHRSLDERCVEAVRKLQVGGSQVLSIDMPSGIDAATGAVHGTAVQAHRTVTFGRRRAGHLLLPGRTHCGAVIVADIGIPSEVWADVPALAHANEPALWLDRLRHPSAAGHKYDRGHAVVLAGPLEKSGAARLAAIGALRAGAGLVTLGAERGALAGLASQVTAVMLRACDDPRDLGEILEDGRLNAFVLGPGFGDADKARTYTAAILQAARALVLDADAITAFAKQPDELFGLCETARGGTVLTPHAGEFKRLFPEIAADESLSKLQAAIAAARQAHAVVVFKGADTVIAAPDGRAAINAVGTPWLATAGTGDVLAGIIGAQLAQGTPVFEAACAGVWMHGRAAEQFGPGLISEDLPGMLPRVHAEIAALRGA